MEIGKLIPKSIPEVASEQSTVAPDCYENFVVWVVHACLKV